MKVYCPVENIDKTVQQCLEEGCHDLGFMAMCLGNKPSDHIYEQAPTQTCGCVCQCHAPASRCVREAVIEVSSRKGLVASCTVCIFQC